MCQIRYFLSGVKQQLGFPTCRRRHPHGCRRSSRSDKGRIVVLIQMFLDGGCDYVQYSSPRRKESLIWSVLWGSKERLACCALQGEDGTWIYSVLTVGPFTAV
jgi:hypothetical protein